MASKSKDLTAEIEKTHPGFIIICGDCKSHNVYIENSMGYSDVSGMYGEVELVCYDCDKRCELAS